MEKYSNNPSSGVEYPAILIQKIKFGPLLENLKEVFELSSIKKDKKVDNKYRKLVSVLLINGKSANILGKGILCEKSILYLNDNMISYTYYESKGNKIDINIKDFIDPLTLNPLILEETKEIINNNSEEIEDINDLSLEELFGEDEQNPIEEFKPIEWGE